MDSKVPRPSPGTCFCDMDAQGRCWPCREAVRSFVQGMIAFALASNSLSKICKSCLKGTMDEITAEVMQQFAEEDPTADRRREIAQIINGFLATAPLDSKKHILVELARQASLDQGVSR